MSLLPPYDYSSHNLPDLVRSTRCTYITSEGSVHALADLPVALSSFGVAKYKQEVVIFGGEMGAGVLSGSVFKYDFMADTWTPEGALPSARKWPACGALERGVGDPVLICAGGDDGTGTFNEHFLFFDPMSPGSGWAQTPVAGTNFPSVGMVHNDKFYWYNGKFKLPWLYSVLPI